MGQYFTPRPIVQFMVDMLEPTNKDKVIDPACGSGGFLLYSLERLQKQAEELFDTPDERRDYWRNWALTCLHGIEINSQISRVAMMGMILHEDGHTNIRCTDALQLYDEIMKYGDTVEIKPGAFTLLMTNPPFGASVKRVTPKAGHPYLDTYELGGKVKEGDTKERKRDSQKTEILFLERCLDLLAEKGRMGIVLPEGIYNNPSLGYVREFVEDRAFISAVVSLPPETFVSSGASVKASLLFLSKYSNQERRRFNAEKVKATAETVAKYAPERERLEQEYRRRIECCDRDEVRQLLDEINTAKNQSEQLAAKVRTNNDPRRREALKTERQSVKTRVKELLDRMNKTITPKDRHRKKELELELRTKLRKMEERIQQESRQLLKQRFDYPVFMAEAEHVGITATGQEDENEFPEIVKAYKRFKANPSKFMKECERSQRGSNRKETD
jgi:type I restriction enzyme M protein